MFLYECTLPSKYKTKNLKILTYFCFYYICYNTWYLIKFPIDLHIAADCGGEIDLSLTGQPAIESPGYVHPGNYDSYQECSWLIKVALQAEILTNKFLNIVKVQNNYCYSEIWSIA